MSDYLSDSPVVTRSYCPGCEPDVDPSRDLVETRHCERHAPPREGADDDAVRTQSYMSGSAEAGGEDNRRWCDVLHGRSQPEPQTKEEPTPPCEPRADYFC